MITFIMFIYSFFIILLAGRLLFEVPALSLKDEIFGKRIPIYFMSGSIILSLYMFMLFFLNIKYSIVSISAPFIIYLAYYLWTNGRKAPQVMDDTVKYYQSLFNKAAKRENLLYTGILIVLAGIVVELFLNNLIVPIFNGDANNMWFLKPKMIFNARTIPQDLYLNKQYFYTVFIYPLLTSLNVAWVTIAMDKWSDTLPKTFYSLQYLATLIFFYFSLKDRVGSRTALIGAFVTFTVPHVMGDITTGYVDLIVAFFGCFSVICMFNWMNDMSKRRYFYLMALFLGGAIFTHDQGMIFLVATLMTLAIFFAVNLMKGTIRTAETINYSLWFVLILAAVTGPFKLFRKAMPIESHWIPGIWQLINFIPNLARIPIILNYLVYEFFLDTYLWMYFWIFFFLIVFINRKTIFSTDLSYLFSFILFSFAMIFGVFLIGIVGTIPDGLINSLGQNLDRALLILPPAAGFLMFASFAGYTGKE